MSVWSTNLDTLTKGWSQSEHKAGRRVISIEVSLVGGNTVVLSGSVADQNATNETQLLVSAIRFSDNDPDCDCVIITRDLTRLFCYVKGIDELSPAVQRRASAAIRNRSAWDRVKNHRHQKISDAIVHRVGPGILFSRILNYTKPQPYGNKPGPNRPFVVHPWSQIPQLLQLMAKPPQNSTQQGARRLTSPSTTNPRPTSGPTSESMDGARCSFSSSQ